jgi:hypothetical protein
MKKAVTQNIGTTHTAFFFWFDSLTRTEKRICLAFSYYHAKLVSGEHQAVFPKMETIAQFAGCARETVCRFVQKYNGVLFHKRSRFNAELGKNLSNVYELNYEFFEFLWLLERCNKTNLFLDGGVSKRGLGAKMRLLKAISEVGPGEAEFLVKFVYEKLGLINMKCHKVFLPKCHTMNSSSYELHVSKVLLSRAPHTRKEKEGPGVLKDLPISDLERLKLTKMFLEVDLRKARLDYFYVDSSKGVQKPANFLFMRAREHNLRRLHAL